MQTITADPQTTARILRRVVEFLSFHGIQIKVADLQIEETNQLRFCSGWVTSSTSVESHQHRRLIEKEFETAMRFSYLFRGCYLVLKPGAFYVTKGYVIHNTKTERTKCA